MSEIINGDSDERSLSMNIYASFSFSSGKLHDIEQYYNAIQRRILKQQTPSMLSTQTPCSTPATPSKRTQTAPRKQIIQMTIQYSPQLHNRAILLLLLLIRPTKTFTLHLHFTSTTLKLLKTFLSFGEFVCCGTVSH